MPCAPLTPNEREIMLMTVEGKTTTEIADFLHVGDQSVRVVRHNLRKKLRVADMDAALLAYEAWLCDEMVLIARLCARIRAAAAVIADTEGDYVSAE